MFCASDGRVDHVSRYAGKGHMVQAPGGQQVQVSPVGTGLPVPEFVGARSYLR